MKRKKFINFLIFFLFLDKQRQKTSSTSSNSSNENHQKTHHNDNDKKHYRSSSDETNIKSRSTKSKSLIATKNLIPSIEVSVKQTLNESESDSVSLAGDLAKNNNNNILVTKSSNLREKQERDKSGKRKSNLNRAFIVDTTSVISTIGEFLFFIFLCFLLSLVLSL